MSKIGRDGHYSSLYGDQYSSSSPGYRSLNQNPTLSTMSTPTNSISAQYVSYNPLPPPPPPKCKTPISHHEMSVRQCRNIYQPSPTDAVRTSPAKMLTNIKPDPRIDPYAPCMMYHTMQVIILNDFNFKLALIGN